MATSFALSNAGHPPDELRVTAAVDLVRSGEGFVIQTIGLELEARVPGIDAAKFQEVAEAAKKGCPLSRALAATPITLSAKLLS
jgi:osmotically inducible protein OsmC